MLLCPNHTLITLSVAEKGDFLALDLGGTNFRVLHVRVVEEEQKVLKMDSQICAIPKEMMLGPGEEVRPFPGSSLLFFASVQMKLRWGQTVSSSSTTSQRV